MQNQYSCTKGLDLRHRFLSKKKSFERKISRGRVREENVSCKSTILECNISWKSFPRFSNCLMWINWRTDSLSILIGAQQNCERGKMNYAGKLWGQVREDGLMGICEGFWVWSRRLCACLATGRPCHGMMKELLHRLRSHVQIRTPATCCGWHEQVTPLPDIIIVRRVRKIAKSDCYLRRVCVCLFVCLCPSVRMEHFGCHRTEIHKIW